MCIIAKVCVGNTKLCLGTTKNILVRQMTWEGKKKTKVTFVLPYKKDPLMM